MNGKVDRGLIALGAYFIIGCAVAAGFKAVEWLVPRPEMRVIVCTYDDLKETECRPAAELMRKAAKRT